MTTAAKTQPFFPHSPWDVVPVLAGVAHFTYVILLFVLFPKLPWWALGILGLIYSVSISWNINGISHNFLHNPYFRSPLLNRLFSIMESLTCGFSQVLYKYVHLRHHQGNSDRPDERGDTIDWLSIYRHGKNGAPENLFKYVFLSYFRDDPKAIFQETKKYSVTEARWGVAEVVMFLSFYALGFVLNWKFMLYFLPFYYFGHCLSYLNGFYRHYGGNPDVPMAWGVSSYNRLYNWLWFNNGYHAEHHFRPKMHWLRMKDFHQQFAAEQRKAGVHVIAPPHALGFLASWWRTSPAKSEPLADLPG